jgi:hypothetical protein
MHDINRMDIECIVAPSSMCLRALDIDGWHKIVELLTAKLDHLLPMYYDLLRPCLLPAYSSGQVSRNSSRRHVCSTGVILSPPAGPLRSQLEIQMQGIISGWYMQSMYPL